MDQFAALNCSLRPCTLSTSNALWNTLKACWWERPHFLGFVLIWDLLFPKNSTFHTCRHLSVYLSLWPPAEEQHFRKTKVLTHFWRIPIAPFSWSWEFLCQSRMIFLVWFSKATPFKTLEYLMFWWEFIHKAANDSQGLIIPHTTPVWKKDQELSWEKWGIGS